MAQTANAGVLAAPKCPILPATVSRLRDTLFPPLGPCPACWLPCALVTTPERHSRSSASEKPPAVRTVSPSPPDTLSCHGLSCFSPPPRRSFLQVGVLPAAQCLACAALNKDLLNDGKWEGRNHQELWGGGVSLKTMKMQTK